jgi:spore germination protein KA
MSSTTGSAISILGGLILGDAAVKAGIMSPIMIIVIAISAIAGLVFTSIEMANTVRLWRIILLVLATIFGLFGVYIGAILLIASLANTRSFKRPYLAPFSPFIKNEQKDAIFKSKNVGVKYRNPLLAIKNMIRGKY